MVDAKRSRKHTQTIQVRLFQKDKTAGRNRTAFLTVIHSGGRDLGLHILVEKPIILGRAPDCDLCLHDMGVSWHHARVSPDADGYMIQDLESTNGTLIDGVEISNPEKLRDGQKIFIGDTVVRFSLADELEIGFHDQLTHLAGTDSLTGLDAKQKFDNALDYALEVARRWSQPLSVLMMDLDGVKQINDTHGHLYGAFTIEKAGKIIAAKIHKAGRACRFGGDEFTAFLPNQDKVRAFELAESIRSAIETEKIEKNSIRLHPTICIGVASYPEDAQTVIELLTKADQALYRAKSLGKNRVAT